MNARRLLLAAGLATSTASTVALLALDPVLTAAYDGRGPAILVRIIEGRDVHPLSFYQDLAATRIRLPLLATAALGLLAAIAAASTPRRRQRVARIADGRAGLALTVLAVLGVLAVALALLQRETLPALVISEVVTSNANLAPDEDGDFPDWIELWNTTDEPVELAGYRLIRDGSHLWELPPGLIEPDGRLVIHASGKDRSQWPTQAAFWFDADDPGALAALELELGPLDPETGNPDWLEVTFIAEGELDLGSLGLRESGRRPSEELLPTGVPHRVELAGPDLPRRPLHTSFALSREGVLLELHGPEEVDAVEVPASLRNVSFGRNPVTPSRWCWFFLPTPAAPNDRNCFDDDRLGAPSLSHATGVYDAGFELTIDIDEGSGPILYTLDGTYPELQRNPRSTRIYERPIAIDIPPAVTGPLSRIDTTITDPAMEYSVLFREPMNVSADIRPGVTIRARTADSAESVATYLFPEKTSGAADRLPFIALTLDPDHLFDHETGIYIAGATFEQWRSGDRFNSARRWDAPANYRGRTRTWERPFAADLEDAVHLEVCNRDGCEDAIQTGIRIHGNASRMWPQHSLRLYARDDYNTPSFEADLFGDGASGWRTLILRNGGNNSNTFSAAFHFHDAFFQSTMSDLRADTQAFAPFAVYINGEYWGIHNLRERFDTTYVQVRRGVEADNVAMLGTGPSAPQPPEIVAHWESLVEDARRLDPTDPGSLALIEAAMDVDSFFDFIIGHTYAGNTDWPSNNSRWWRSIEATDAVGEGYADGRWRWMIMDIDRIGNSTLRADVTHPTLLDRLPPSSGVSHARLLHGLLRFPEFREMFFERYEEHLSSTFSAQRMEMLLDELVDLIGSEMIEHQRRWLHYGVESSEDAEPWEDRVEEIRAFVRERPDQVRGHLERAAIEWFPAVD